MGHLKDGVLPLTVLQDSFHIFESVKELGVVCELCRHSGIGTRLCGHAPAEGNPVMEKNRRMGAHRKLSGGSTPKIGLRLANSKMEPTCHPTHTFSWCSIPQYVKAFLL